MLCYTRNSGSPMGGALHTVRAQWNLNRFSLHQTISAHDQPPRRDVGIDLLSNRKLEDKFRTFVRGKASLGIATLSRAHRRRVCIACWFSGWELDSLRCAIKRVRVLVRLVGGLNEPYAKVYRGKSVLFTIHHWRAVRGRSVYKEIQYGSKKPDPSNVCLFGNWYISDQRFDTMLEMQ